MNLGAYELLYERGQLPTLGKPFLTYDSSDINQSEFRELLAFDRFCQTGVWRNHELSGLFSPRFFEKMGVTTSSFTAFLAENPGYDVYLFHPYPLELSIQNTFLDLAELEHPGIQEVLSEVWLKIFDEDLPQIKLPQDQNICCHCNYVLARPSFWGPYSNFVNSFMALLRSSDDGCLKVTTPYTLSKTTDTHLPIGVFAFERALSHFIKRFVHSKKVINFAYQHSNWESVELFPNEKNFVQSLLLADIYPFKNTESAKLSHNVIATQAYYHYRKNWNFK